LTVDICFDRGRAEPGNVMVSSKTDNPFRQAAHPGFFRFYEKKTKLLIFNFEKKMFFLDERKLLRRLWTKKSTF